MTARTYVDAVGVMGAWINSREATLVGPGNPLQMGAHFKKLGGGEPAAYAYLEEQVSLRSPDGAENPDMVAVLSAQVYGGLGGTREAATNAAVALAEELSTVLDGRPATVNTQNGQATICAVDDIQGPIRAPDGRQGEIPRLLVNFTVRLQPA